MSKLAPCDHDECGITKCRKGLDGAACSPCDIANGLLHAADDHPCCKATLHAAANLLANMPTAHGPLRQAYSRQELADKLKVWMIELWGGAPKNLDQEQRDQWHRDNGLIYHFICDHFPEENTGAQATTPAPDQTTKKT